MKFLIVPDSFKNCLSSSDVGKYIAQGIFKSFPDAIIKAIPVADGGEGTVQAIMQAVGGQIKTVQAHNPLMQPIESFFGIMPDKRTAVIEMAAASGIELISTQDRNPLLTTTYGTGELIKAALDEGCDNIIIGIGGSATNDLGVGMAMALGVKFTTKDNQAIEKGAKYLEDICTIDISAIDKRIANTQIRVACDVKNVLCGENGATAVFGPQKGASPQMVKQLDQVLNKVAQLIEKQLDINVKSIEGGGAAGGLGAGLVAFTQAKLCGGFSLIAELLKLDHEIEQTDIVITAEGAIDFQTLFGKTPAGVAQIAKKHKKPVFVFAGSASEDASNFNASDITAIIPITRRPVLLDEAIRLAPIWLKQSAFELCQTLKAGINLT